MTAPSSVSQQAALLPRGVWLCPHLSIRDEVQLVVVNSRHRSVAGPVAVPEGVTLESVEARLWDLLNTLEPQPQAVAA